MTWAAIKVGYYSTSAFVGQLRRVLGTTPGRYFRRRAADGEEEQSGVRDRSRRAGAGRA